MARKRELERCKKKVERCMNYVTKDGEYYCRKLEFCYPCEPTGRQYGGIWKHACEGCQWFDDGGKV